MSRRRLIFLCLVCIASATAVFAAHLVEQEVELQPGWNAVYVEVDPVTNDMVTVFRDVPISSVWTYIRRGEPTEFFQNLAEDLHTDPHWLVFFPTNRHERMFNDLYRLQANRAYFIKLAGSNAYTWTIDGRPAVPKYTWDPNEFNMVGFPMNPEAAQPMMEDFFSRDPSLAGQAMYRLNATGAWELVSSPAAENMEAGESMWVYAAGESTYLGPLAVSVDIGDGLDYGGTLTELSVWLENRGVVSASVQVRDLSGAGGPLCYWTFDTTTSTVVWQDLPDPLTLGVATGTPHRLRLGVRRENFVSDTYETTVEVLGDLGTRVRIPLTARKSEGVEP